ncbi:uncharacterized protein LOC105696631 isoform X2 [Orussus abietinus]|uniref:uncharacterized protein LOC105696631 isoform X2 n=1 Tax=Orussus abietinus TaxID=222816 RepID=UPI0006268A78|nr:uncharacterized protein LOC105696631 isoform X2 [Orussus abietinus]
MSINVTVNGNPISIRRGRMVLSDLDQIKKCERDRRRRLRLEQVRQQSKEISNRLLERARNVTEKELSRLEKDGKSELKKMHDRKIMDIQQKYQEELEDIGQAHISATLQPDAETLIEAKNRKNRVSAIERGKEAGQRLKETSQKENPQATHQKRLQQVREVENVRSSLVANLSKRSCTKKCCEDYSDVLEEEDINNVPSQQKSPVKTKEQKLNKASSVKPTSNQIDSKVIAEKQKAKSPPRIISSTGQNKSFSPQPGPSGLQKIRSFKHDSETTSEMSRTASTIPRLQDIAEVSGDSDDQEPRKSTPVSKVTPSKADKIASYNPEDYKPQSSVSSSTSSLSDDSSYFSDGGKESRKTKTTPKHHTSLAGSKVQLYDHNTRQRNAYDRPAGLVERTDIRTEPNAEDAARRVRESESVVSQLIECRKINAQQRGNQAILRNRVRRDYQALVQNLDRLASEERKLKASQLHDRAGKNPHMNRSRRKECQEEQQRKMDRAFTDILHNTCTANSSQTEERIVTITPRANQEIHVRSPRPVWQERPFKERQVHGPTQGDNEQGEELSRAEQVLEMLKRVERQKRLLLREFGVDLPDNILSSSMTALFTEQRTEAMLERNAVRPKPLSPEIKVIHMSSDEASEKIKKTKKKEPLPKKQMEIAVQTSILDEMRVSQDKSVQVTLVQEKFSESSLASEEGPVDTSGQNADESNGTNISREAEEESTAASTESVVTGVVIDIDKKHVKVTPKKKKSPKRFKRVSSRAFLKPRSVPSSKTSSPIKKSSKSAPASRTSSPQKTTTKSVSIGSPAKKVKISINKGGLKVNVDPPFQLKPTDTSTDSSQVYVTPDVQVPSTSRAHQEFHQSPNIVLRPRDTSDTSTSYASPPPVIPASMRRMMNNTTPILELLNSSVTDDPRQSRREISPVSSPETPSPRVLNIPSNIPHPERISRILQYKMANEQIRAHKTPQNQDSRSASRERSSQRQRRRKSSKEKPETVETCLCTNPTCKLFHEKVDIIQRYSLNNCPEILQKYEDLQNMCTERIASLTDLIERVRIEQRGMEFSDMAPSDETSFMQLPQSQTGRNELYSVRRLVQSIEAIHNQLAKTLQESQRIIIGEGTPQPSGSSDKATSNIAREAKITHSISTSTEDRVEKMDTRAKARVISDVPVNICLNRLRTSNRPHTAMRLSMENESWPTSQSSRQQEDIVEKLSKEILEQSKGLDKSFETQKENENVCKQRTPSPRQHSPPERQLSPQVQKAKPHDSKEHDPNIQLPKEMDFVPLLAGIPKVPRASSSSSAINNRGRPPITLASGPFRTDDESPGHELSTIVEFDTPDTANRSQGSVRSPSGKSKRALPADARSEVSSLKMTIEPSTKQMTEIQVPSTPQHPGKPSVHVAPLPATNTPRSLSKSSSRKMNPLLKVSSEILTSASKWESLDANVYTTPRKPKSLTLHKDGSTDSRDLGEIVNIEGEKGATGDQIDSSIKNKQEHSDRSERYVPSVLSSSVEPCNQNQANKDKLTSTSSNSFSGLSGISEITSTPTSDMLKDSSQEGVEDALKKLGLGWAVATLKKTREASALSSSSNSDITPMNTARRMISPMKKSHENNICGLPDFSDVSSISIKDISKSTERAVLLKGRTSTPNIQISNSNSGKSSSTTSSSSGISLQDPSDTFTAPNVSLSKKKPSRTDREAVPE